MSVHLLTSGFGNVWFEQRYGNDLFQGPTTPLIKKFDLNLLTEHITKHTKESIWKIFKTYIYIYYIYGIYKEYP